MGFGVCITIPIWGQFALAGFLHITCAHCLNWKKKRFVVGPFYSFFQMKEEIWFGLDWYGLNFEHTYHLGLGTYWVLLKFL
jgi:hypothetical protein